MDKEDIKKQGNFSKKFHQKVLEEWVRKRYNLDSWKLKDAIKDAKTRSDVIDMRDLAIEKTVKQILKDIKNGCTKGYVEELRKKWCKE